MLVPQLGDLGKDTLKQMKDEAFKAELFFFFGYLVMKGRFLRTYGPVGEHKRKVVECV